MSREFLYLFLVLPSLFGLTMTGEGLTRIFHEDKGGFISLFFGIIFLGITGFGFILSK